MNEALSDEVNLLGVRLVVDDDFSWSEDSAKQVDDHLVRETSLAFFKEVVEGPLKFLEDSCVLDELSLHLRSDLLIERELFDDQVEVIEESLLYINSDVVVKSWLDVKWLV